MKQPRKRNVTGTILQEEYIFLLFLVVGIKGEKDIHMLTGKKQNSAQKARQTTFHSFVVGARSVSLKAEKRKVHVRRQHKGPSCNKANSHHSPSQIDIYHVYSIRLQARFWWKFATYYGFYTYICQSRKNINVCNTDFIILR